MSDLPFTKTLFDDTAAGFKSEAEMYAKERRDYAIKNLTPIGIIHSSGRGHHGYHDFDQTVAMNGQVYYRVYLAPPDVELLQEEIVRLRDQVYSLTGKITSQEQPSQYFTMSDSEITAFERLREALGQQETCLHTVLACATVRIRRLTFEATKKVTTNL